MNTYFEARVFGRFLKISKIVLPVVSFMFGAGVAKADETAVTIPTRPDVTVSFLVNIPAHPVAAVVMFPGGNGMFDIVAQDGQVSTRNNNFLVRTRQMFASANIANLVLDVPSDHPYGVGETYRRGANDARDVTAVLAWYKQRVSAPIWLVGTSMGTISATADAIRLGSAINGLVVTSSISASGRSAPSGGLSTLDLAAINVPVLVMDDTLDACPISPPGNAPWLARRMKNAPRTQVTLIDGGATPMSSPCDALSYHGYYGVETKAVNTMIGFIETK